MCMQSLHPKNCKLHPKCGNDRIVEWRSELEVLKTEARGYTNIVKFLKRALSANEEGRAKRAQRDL